MKRKKGKGAKEKYGFKMRTLFDAVQGKLGFLEHSLLC